MIRATPDGLAVAGPVTMNTVAGLVPEGLKHIRSDQDTVIDWTEVTEADSAALSVLLAWTRASQARGRRVILRNGNHNLKALADLYGVADLLSLS